MVALLLLRENRHIDDARVLGNLLMHSGRNSGSVRVGVDPDVVAKDSREFFRRNHRFFNIPSLYHCESREETEKGEGSVPEESQRKASVMRWVSVSRSIRIGTRAAFTSAPSVILTRGLNGRAHTLILQRLASSKTRQ